MSEPTWEQLFEAVGQVPGSTKQQPSKETFEELGRKTEFARKRYASDVAVAMGAVDTGDDFDPLTAINDQYNAGGQSTADLKRETTQIAAGLAQLQADVTANNNSGKSLQVAVSDYETAMPTEFEKFSDWGSGAVYNDGNTLQMSNADGRELFKYALEDLATDYFEVSLIVPRQAGATFGNYVNRALFFIGRADAAFDNYCFARLNGNLLRVGAVIDGVSTIDSPTWFGAGPLGTGSTQLAISPGIYMTFAGGTLAGARFFQFKVNNQVRATFRDVSEVSLLGEDYRWTGFGIRNDNDQRNESPSVSHLVANDNAPAEIVGSGITLVRLSTGTWGLSSGTNVLGGGFWDSQEEASPDFLAGLDLGLGEITIPESDWHTIAVSARVGSSWPNHFRWVLYKNGLPYKHFGSDHMFGSNALGGTILPDQAAGTWAGYLTKGDKIRIGYNSDGIAANALRGTADGSQTWWTVRRGAA